MIIIKSLSIEDTTKLFAQSTIEKP